MVELQPEWSLVPVCPTSSYAAPLRQTSPATVDATRGMSGFCSLGVVESLALNYSIAAFGISAYVIVSSMDESILEVRFGVGWALDGWIVSAIS